MEPVTMRLRPHKRSPSRDESRLGASDPLARRAAQRRRRPAGHTARTGTALAGTMVFLALVMLLWVGVHRQTAAYLRVEKTSLLRQQRAVGGTRALAWGLALLETGLPPADPYRCRALVDAGTSFVLTFRQEDGQVYSVTVRPAAPEERALPAAPNNF